MLTWQISPSLFPYYSGQSTSKPNTISSSGWMWVMDAGKDEVTQLHVELSWTQLIFCYLEECAYTCHTTLHQSQEAGPPCLTIKPLNTKQASEAMEYWSILVTWKTLHYWKYKSALKISHRIHLLVHTHHCNELLFLLHPFCIHFLI